MAVNRDYLPGKRTKPPLHPVSDDGVADLAADCETDALRRISIGPVTHKEHESSRRGAPSGVRREEVRAFPYCS